MSEYYTEKTITKTNFSKDDTISVIIIFFLLLETLIFSITRKDDNLKVIDPYYKERFVAVPSYDDRFSNENYEIAITNLYVHDEIRDLKYKFDDLNNAMSRFVQEQKKQKAMNEIRLILERIRKGKIEVSDLIEMQKAVKEAGFGEMDIASLEKVTRDYQENLSRRQRIASEIESEKQKIVSSIEEDAKETGGFAIDIAKTIAEDEIQGFIDNLTIMARIGGFVVNKVKEKTTTTEE